MMTILVGPSSVGKSSIGFAMEKLGFTMLRSVTTRDPRFPGETEYDFVTDDEFDSFEFAEGPIHYAGKRYGLTMQEVEKTHDLTKDFVVICEIHGALQLKSNVKCPCVLVFIDAPDADLVARLEKRGAPEIEKRIARFPQDREGIPYCDFVVNNVNCEYVEDAVLGRAAYIILKAKGKI